MQHLKAGTVKWYNLTITEEAAGEAGDTSRVYKWMLRLDASGLAALIRSTDLATNEGQMARAIGLRRKKKKRAQ